VSWIEKRRAAVPGGELAFADEGDPGSPPVLLIHGDLTSSFLWRQLVPMFAPWMRAIAPDLLGHGDSGPAGEGDLALAGQTAAVRGLLDGLGIERFAAIGHAGGGGIAQRLAVEGRVDTLVLIDTAALGSWPRGMVDPSPPGDAAAVRDGVRRLFDRAMSRRERLSDAELAEYLRPFDGKDGVSAFVRASAAAEGRGFEDPTAGLEELEIPTFVLWGEDDAFLEPALAERLGEVLPWATVALLPGCGHLLLEDAPETVAPLIFQFLRTRYLKIEHRHEEGPVTVYLGRRPPGEGG
jgi:pimeloyl-ACP methyl ester carboxylesterase